MGDGATPRIGCFDSGIGGLTVLRHVLAACPGVPCLYVGDLKHVPYGQRTLPEIRTIACAVMDWLVAEGCTHLVVACNTSTAALKDEPYDPGVPVLNVIDPLAAWILAHPTLRSLGVVANPVTAQRAIHAAVLHLARPDLEVVTVAAPTLVPLLESDAPQVQIQQSVSTALEPLTTAEVQGCIYGCTHYPLAATQFMQTLGSDVRLIDTGALVAEALAACLPPASTTAPGPVEFVITAPSDDFSRWVARLLPREVPWSLRVTDVFASNLHSIGA